MLEFLLFATFIYLNLKRPLLKHIVLAMSAIFLLTAIGLRLYYGNLDFQSPIFSIENIIIIPLCVLYFYEQITKPDTLFVYLLKSFWVVLGIIIYVTGTLFVFSYIDSLPPAEQNKYWVINLIFNTTKNLFFAIALLINETKQKKYKTADPFLYSL